MINVSSLRPLGVQRGIVRSEAVGTRLASPTFGHQPQVSQKPPNEQGQQPAGSKFHRTLIWLFTGVLAAGIGGNAMQTRLFNKYIEKDKAHYNSQLSKHALISQALAKQIDERITMDQIMRVAEQVTPATVRVEGTSGLGSGVIIQDSKGKLYVITNGHVTQDNAVFNGGKQTYTIKLYNGSDYKDPIQFNASIMKAPGGGKAESPPEKHDLALLEIPSDVKLPPNVKPVEMRDMVKDPVKVGEVVIAVGNPLGLRDNVSSGIVSNVDRRFDLEPENKFLGTDAPINPGNSGGGLFDMKGRLIGINTLGAQGADGIAGSIRVDVVQQVLQGWGVKVNPKG